MESIEEMRNIIENYADIRNTIEKIAIERIQDKMNCLNIGFGESNSFESMEIIKDKNNQIIIEMQFIDFNYDLRDEVIKSITLDELLMTDEEWKNQLEKYSNEFKLE